MTRRLVGCSPWGRQELGTTEALTLSLYVPSWMNLSLSPTRFVSEKTTTVVPNGGDNIMFQNQDLEIAAFVPQQGLILKYHLD